MAGKMELLSRVKQGSFVSLSVDKEWEIVSVNDERGTGSRHGILHKVEEIKFFSSTKTKVTLIEYSGEKKEHRTNVIDPVINVFANPLDIKKYFKMVIMEEAERNIGNFPLSIVKYGSVIQVGVKEGIAYAQQEGISRGVPYAYKKLVDIKNPADMTRKITGVFAEIFRKTEMSDDCIEIWTLKEGKVTLIVDDFTTDIYVKASPYEILKTFE